MEPSSADTPPRNRAVTVPFVSLGSAAIIFGGLFSAATARSASYHSAWFVAYLILIVGVSQIVLAIGHQQFARAPLRTGSAIGLLLLFNLGNAGVIVGTLAAATLWVDLGSVLLSLALLIFGWTTRFARPTAVQWAYWVFVTLLLVSVVVGLVFAHTGTR